MCEFKIPYEKIKDIPLDEYKNLHKAYWEFIAEHLDECIVGPNNRFVKPFIINKNGERLDISANCFACQYAERNTLDDWDKSIKRCRFCPFVEYRVNRCNSPWTLYWLFVRYPSKERALQIANLKWTDCVE